MLELRRMAEFLESDEEAFAELLAQKTDKELLKEKKHDEKNFKRQLSEMILFLSFMKSYMRTTLSAK